MSLDVIYLAHNRLEFTQASFPNLLENTNWDLVRQLVVFDDRSEDGTRQYLYKAIHGCPVEYHLHETSFGSPVRTMNTYVAGNDSEFFAKIDSDIMVPPGWLDALTQVAAAARHIDALGMEAGREGLNDAAWLEPGFVYGYQPCSHIGGVGLIRTDALGRRPRIVANGRYGWTEFQQQWDLGRAWITPDLRVFSLDQLPFGRWRQLAESYSESGWGRERVWPAYHGRWMSDYWEWAFPDWEAQAYEENEG